MGELSITHWLIVALIMILLFGAKRLPEAARGLGRSMRILKAEVSAKDGAEQATTTLDEQPPTTADVRPQTGTGGTSV